MDEANRLKTSPSPLFDTLDNTQLALTPNSIPQEYNMDYLLALRFLHSYRGSEATFNSYRREVERLLQWCWLVEKRPLNTLKRDDFERFVIFCQNPPTTWIGT